MFLDRVMFATQRSAVGEHSVPSGDHTAGLLLSAESVSRCSLIRPHTCTHTHIAPAVAVVHVGPAGWLLGAARDAKCLLMQLTHRLDETAHRHASLLMWSSLLTKNPFKH